MRRRTMSAASSRSYNPMKFIPRLRSSSGYEKLPGFEPVQSPGVDSPGLAKKRTPRFLQNVAPTSRSRIVRWVVRLVIFAILCGIIAAVFGHKKYEHQQEVKQHEEDKSAEENANTRYWEAFPQLKGYFNGIRTLVRVPEWEPEPLQAGMTMPYKNKDAKPQPPKEADPPKEKARELPPVDGPLPLSPQRYDPYPAYNSTEYLAKHHPVEPCFLDEDDTRPAPDIFVYPGVPQNFPQPFFGIHDELGMRDDICFDRFGRLGTYGYGYSAAEGGTGLGMRSEQQGIEEIWALQPKIDWRDVDWAQAQSRCYSKNKKRFEVEKSHHRGGDGKRQAPSAPTEKVSRSAYVLRTWTGFEYTPHEVLALRSMINELSLKSGGEYDVHLLLHVKDDTIPIWTSTEIYQRVIEENIPPEFWGITTLWSVQLMRMYYPGPFGEPPANIAGQEIHGVYRSAHFAMQWFAQEHREYDYIWNWEMDMRYSGHYYEFHNGVAEWAKKQPRRGLWERNEKFWIPALHGSWENFTSFVDRETLDKGEQPVWGPVTFPHSGMLESPPENQPPRPVLEDKFEWGVGEEADYIAFDPIFDPSETNWVFRKDISGYDLNLPIPPRRCAIITVSRLSRRLLDMMHNETYIGKHSAFPEMWPPTVALHHGMKAVYIPHPVYFDRQWPLEYMDQVFNYPETKINSPFGWGEHNWLGSSFYYNSGFSGALWRRWLGEMENNEGGAGFEIEGTGRMCLRSTLHHPIKSEASPESS